MSLLKGVAVILVLGLLLGLMSDWDPVNVPPVPFMQEFMDAFNETNQPFNNLPPFPEIPGPSANLTSDGDTFWFRDANVGLDDPQCSFGQKELIEAQGSSAKSINITTNGQSACWSHTTLQGLAPGLVNVSMDLSAAGNVTWTLRVMRSHNGLSSWDAFSTWETICIFSSQTEVGDDVLRSCNQGGWSFQFPWRKLTVVLTKNTGATLTIAYDGSGGSNDSFVETPSGIAAQAGCEWWDVGCNASSALDWAGGGFFYVGGVIWTVLVYIGSIIWWVGTVIALFVALIFGIIGYGFVLPAPWNVIVGVPLVLFGVTFIIFFLNLIRGGVPG